ncbi:hypothetical protein Nepgr_010908 [Nepenthes gracilis]|uniref:Uncharacterized protein n=1 Tax=Nepenthes gracilis TaxID=150966 RepID=A0AAD3SDA1_NEPGR|nr:hypothetical protein Nepgr_010908 [Nepenthes gracilis]
MARFRNYIGKIDDVEAVSESLSGGKSCKVVAVLQSGRKLGDSVGCHLPVVDDGLIHCGFDGSSVPKKFCSYFGRKVGDCAGYRLPEVADGLTQRGSDDSSAPAKFCKVGISGRHLLPSGDGCRIHLGAASNSVPEEIVGIKGEPTKDPKSWAKIVQSEVSFPGTQLTYFPSSIMDGKVVIRPPIEVTCGGADLWKDVMSMDVEGSCRFDLAPGLESTMRSTGVKLGVSSNNDKGKYGEGVAKEIRDNINKKKL